MSKTFPDYYKLLNVDRNASEDQIRAAYKKESLKTHPDRLANASAAEKKRATERFQAIADAYYILSDPQRRSEYDSLHASRAYSGSDDSNASSNFFNTFANMFGQAAGGVGTSSGTQRGENRPDADSLFGDVFEELLRPEVDRHVPWWSYLGAISGSGLGFIIANLPGLMLGAFTGYRLGAIRDAKGKSVAAVFSELGGDQKAEILRALAMKVLGTAL